MADGSVDRATEMGGDARVTRTRADIARTALDVLTREGADALTHARVAEMAGYSKSTLYAHWPSKFDLYVTALGALDEMPHHESTGDLRTDLIEELRMFRRAVLELRLDRVITAMAQWATIEGMSRLRDEINSNAQRPMRMMLAGVFQGAELEAALSMLAGVVACPALMFGEVPDDHVIEAAVDVVLKTAPMAGSPIATV